jgi:hypothetical protein
LSKKHIVRKAQKRRRRNRQKAKERRKLTPIEKIKRRL